MQLVQGETYRLPRDGKDLPADQQVSQTARFNTAAGVITDVEFTPTAPGAYSFEVTKIVNTKPADVVIMPIRVRAP